MKKSGFLIVILGIGVGLLLKIDGRSSSSFGRGMHCSMGSLRGRSCAGIPSRSFMQRTSAPRMTQHLGPGRNFVRNVPTSRRFALHGQSFRSSLSQQKSHSITFGNTSPSQSVARAFSSGSLEKKRPRSVQFKQATTGNSSLNSQKSVIRATAHGPTRNNTSGTGNSPRNAQGRTQSIAYNMPDQRNSTNTRIDQGRSEHHHHSRHHNHTSNNNNFGNNFGCGGYGYGGFGYGFGFGLYDPWWYYPWWYSPWWLYPGYYPGYPGFYFGISYPFVFDPLLL